MGYFEMPAEILPWIPHAKIRNPLIVNFPQSSKFGTNVLDFFADAVYK